MCVRWNDGGQSSGLWGRQTERMIMKDEPLKLGAMGIMDVFTEVMISQDGGHG